ncbi:basic leucine zipper 34-like [Nicotiana tabacum]|uniref:Basic leucine zipper 34-like n=2 Tax=Nicotiana TaxID=4085 RepID=A0A1S3YLD9_TOBAC|nr:PREDICTED: basic leucine zipper 61-like [Nicotiana sylvestris]XP_016452782.1 PREDICTED: basic leucine zipper 61-like [Nicotiana tabacum]
MAQLPPKVPTMAHNWPFQTMPPLHNNNINNNSWVDDFLDFSSARRNSHRRSVSDPIAFVEAAPFLQQCHGGANSSIGFDKLDDEQLTTMFSDDSGGAAAFAVTTAPSSNPSSTNPSTPSDQISENEDQKFVPQVDVNQVIQPKNEPGEVDSSCDTQPPPPPASDSSDNNPIVDPKRIKRILANRQSAQRSRVRKLQYISELERSVTSLQTEVSALSPRVAFLDHQRLLLNVDNSALRQRIAALAQDKIFKDAHQEALKKEIERLRQIYHEQNMKKMGNNGTAHAPPSAAAPPSTFNKMSCTEEA